MAIELASAVAKAVETGKKVAEVAKKVDKATSPIEKATKVVDKVTSEKDENWGADVVKQSIKTKVIEGGSSLSEKLKSFLSKNEPDSGETINTDVDEKAEKKDTVENSNSQNEQETIKDKLNKYLESAESQTDRTGGDNNSKEKTEEVTLETERSDEVQTSSKEEGETNTRNDSKKYSDSNNNIESKNNESSNDAIESEYNEDGTRELTEEEKQALKEKLGWSDEKIKKCTIDRDGVIHYKTDRCDLEGKTSENGVPYERRRITINGVIIEGVFPKFNSVFDTELTSDIKTKAYAKECNEALKEAIKNDPELRSKFTPEQIKDIEEGRTPTGYVWHHNEEPGKMQLVKRNDHDRVIGGAAHTGGNSLWGADSTDNNRKGENF